jgi:hypothetical protein
MSHYRPYNYSICLRMHDYNEKQLKDITKQHNIVSGFTIKIINDHIKSSPLRIYYVTQTNSQMSLLIVQGAIITKIHKLTTNSYFFLKKSFNLG